MSPPAVRSSFHLVDPQIRPLIELWPIDVLTDDSLAEAREMLKAVLTSAESANEVVDDPTILREEIIIPGQMGQADIRAIVHRPTKAGLHPGYFHIHGGGFVMGAPEYTEDRDRRMVATHGCVVISPAYRLAPETKFPGAIEDLYTALKWFHGNAPKLGADPGRIILGGESAGGGLAAALSTLARDRGEIQIAGQMLVYPMLDDRTSSTVERGNFAGEFIWTPQNNRFGWSSILDCEPGSAGVSPYAAASRANDLSKLPPTVMLVGTLDLFFEENVEYLGRLVRSGVATRFCTYAGAYHAFDLAKGSALAVNFARDFEAGMTWLIGDN
jgi:acetyl esterase/lipase